MTSGSAGGRSTDTEEDGGKQQASRGSPHEAEIVLSEIGGFSDGAKVAPTENICGAKRRF